MRKNSYRSRVAFAVNFRVLPGLAVGDASNCSRPAARRSRLTGLLPLIQFAPGPVSSQSFAWRDG
jgi:hypothetical protein